LTGCFIDVAYLFSFKVIELGQSKNVLLWKTLYL